MSTGGDELLSRDELRELLFGDVPNVPPVEREAIFARTFDPQTPDPELPLPDESAWDVFALPDGNDDLSSDDSFDNAQHDGSAGLGGDHLHHAEDLFTAAPSDLDGSAADSPDDTDLAGSDDVSYEDSTFHIAPDDADPSDGTPDHQAEDGDSWEQ